MFSFPEILVILIVAVIVLGPKRLPETARKIGRWVGVFKQAGDEFKRQLMTMDRMVDDSLNRATSDLDQLEPDAVKSYEDVVADIADTFNAPFTAATSASSPSAETPVQEGDKA
jgi:Tat protein translocase TatB subunit